MIGPVLAVTLTLLTLLPVPPPPAPTGPDLAARITEIVDAHHHRDGLPGAVVTVTRGDRVLVATGRGTDATGTPLTADTPVPVASLSKSMTALAAVRLAESGRLDLDRPVRAYLPAFTADPRITVRHLLTQTSGLTDDLTPEFRLPPARSLDEVVAREHGPAADPPGTRFRYHNPNYQILARVVEIASGTPFDDALAREVFAPAGLRATRDAHDTAAMRDVLHGHVRLYGHAWPGTEPDAFDEGSAGIVTTGADLGRWLTLQNRPSGPLAGAVATTHRPGPDPYYAMGWMPEDRGGGDARLTHGGLAFTDTADQVLLPATGEGVAVVVPTGAGLDDDATAVADDVVAVLQGRPTSTAPTATTVADTIMGALTALVVLLGVLGLVRARRWAGRRRSRVAAAVRCVLLVGAPPALLVALPSLVGALFGRVVGWALALHVVPSTVLLLVTASAVTTAVGARRLVLSWRRGARIGGIPGEHQPESALSSG